MKQKVLEEEAHDEVRQGQQKGAGAVLLGVFFYMRGRNGHVSSALLGWRTASDCVRNHALFRGTRPFLWCVTTTLHVCMTKLNSSLGNRS